jgi:hypothetical protein
MFIRMRVAVPSKLEPIIRIYLAFIQSHSVPKENLPIALPSPQILIAIAAILGEKPVSLKYGA